MRRAAFIFAFVALTTACSHDELVATREEPGAATPLPEPSPTTSADVAPPAPVDPLQPHDLGVGEILSIRIEFHHIGLYSEHELKFVIERAGEGYREKDAPVDLALVRELEQSLDGFVLSDKDKSCRQHEDDDRTYGVVIVGKRGTVALRSRSTCPNYAPWNATFDGKGYVQTSGKFGVAFGALFRPIDQRSRR